MTNADDRPDSMDDAPDRPLGSAPSVRDDLDEALAGDRPTDPTDRAGDDDPLTANPGDVGDTGAQSR